MRKTIDAMNIRHVMPMLVDEMLKAKLVEQGGPWTRPRFTWINRFLFAMGWKISQNARTVLERRYLKKDSDGRPAEKPGQMFCTGGAVYSWLPMTLYNQEADVDCRGRDLL